MGSLLVEGDVGLLALRPQGQAALLQLGLGVVPVLVQDKLLQHRSQREKLPEPQTSGAEKAFIPLWASEEGFSPFVFSAPVEIRGYFRPKAAGPEVEQL